MKVHNRTMLIQRLQSEFAIIWLEFTEKHEITFGEGVHILGSLLQDVARYMIRFERHGNYEKKGDEA